MNKKKALLAILALFAVISIASSFIAPQAAPVVKTNSIQWMSWDEAIAKNKKNPKKIFIDAYTDWCGWCKKMDKQTFMNAKVIAYMNDNFYAVKLNAEMKEDIKYNKHTFKFVKNGRRGYHELAASLLNNKMSYPSYVFMNEKVERITIAAGYQNVEKMLCVLHFIGDDKYKTIPFTDFEKTWTQSRN